MIADLEHHNRRYRIDLSRPIDLSLMLTAGPGQVKAWGVGEVRMEPVQDGDTVYAVAQGAPVNFRNVFMNPHGHGTHTESVGHIDAAIPAVGDLLDRYFFVAEVLTILPEERRAPDGKTDRVITLEQIRGTLGERPPEAIVLRTLPNTDAKKHQNWTGTNPPYMQSTATAWLRSIGVRHLLVDMPSVDREEDGGVLAAHHAFWDHPASKNDHRTITELIHVPDRVPDGRFILELQVANWNNDAAPSRPVLYAIASE